MFSEAPGTNRFFPQGPFRRRAVTETWDRVVAEGGLFDRLFLEGLRDPSSLALEDRRALLLMFGRQWWFRGNRSSFYRKPTFARFLRISHRIRRRYGSPGDHLQRFLHEMAQTPFWARLVNRFSYMGNIYRHITDSPHSSDLLTALKREQKNLHSEWENASDEAKPSLEAQREHLDYLISVVDTQTLVPRPWRLPGMGHLSAELLKRPKTSSLPTPVTQL